MRKYIFVLICPKTNTVKYVGKTNNPARKYGQLAYEKREGDALLEWFRSFSRLPEMKVIEETSEEKTKERLEHWKAYYSKHGLIDNSRSKRTAHVSMMFTPDEYEIIKREADANFKGNISKFVRSKLFEKKA